MKNNNKIFPEPIKRLPEADIPIDGIRAYLSQSDTHQILFMEVERDIELPEHSHGAQVGFVLAGEIDLFIDGEKYTFSKGDHYYIPEGIPHSAKMYAGYSDISFFAERDRYKRKDRQV